MELIAAVRPHTHAKRLTRVAFSGYFMVGIAAILFAPLLPEIIAEYDLSLTTAGLLFPAMSLGGLFGGLSAGPLVDRFGTKPIVLASVGLSALGFLVTATSPTWLLVLAGFACMGVGQRALGTCLNTLVAKVNPDNSAKYLNYLHGVYGSGALVAPLVIGAVLFVEGSWRWIFAGPVILWMLFGLVAALQTYPQQARSTEKRSGPAGTVLRSPIFLMLLLVAFGYNGVAFSLLGWVKTYLDMAGNIHPFLSTSMISVFYAALTIGRFVCGTVARRIGYPRTILICAVGTAVTYPLFILSQSPLVVTPAVFCSGLFLSGLYPTALAIATQTFKEKAGTVTGVLTTAMTAGAMIPPWWTGAIAERNGFQFAMGVNMVIVALLLVAAVSLVRLSASTATSLSGGVQRGA